MKLNRFSVVTSLGRASAVALAIGCGAGVAQVQKAFQGTPTIVSGSVFVSQGGVAGTDTVSLNSSTAIINWTPDDTSGTGPIDFLPQNSTVTFSGFSDFTVLNRILPVDGTGASVSRIIELNGTVQSQVGGSPGGSVWFYAPGGIVAGPNSVFNVGSLVLTSNDIDVTNGLPDVANGGTIQFRGATNVLSSVEVKPGASINALSPGSYVALVAPRIVQGGTVKVDGTAAYVAAEAADIRINGGLFDISILAGTTDSNGVVHTGKTELTDSATSSLAQRVYMVAVPKNNALTMLLSGDIGYAAANTVAQVGSTVVLSAGYDVTDGIADSVNANATGKSNISIGASTWQPELNGRATGDIRLRADQGQAITVSGDMNLTAGSGNVGGRIELLTFGGAGPTGNNGRIDVGGNLRLRVDAFGDSNFSSPLPLTGNANAGSIVISATGGSISAASLLATADAESGAGSDRSGNAVGGSISLSALTLNGPGGAEAGSLDFGGVTLSAGARTAYSLSPAIGGNAVGGSIDVAVTGGSATFDNLFVDANGRGGDATGLAGTGVGGNITLSAGMANGLRGNFSISGCSFRCEISANGYGGYGLDGAAGTGGTVLIRGTDANFAVTGELLVQASGVGGGANYQNFLPGRGGNGTGGTINIESRPGSASSSVMRFDSLLLAADGASTENIDGPNYNNGDGGDGIGGATNILVAGGSLIAGNISASASGFGGASDINCTSCGGNGLTPYLSGSGRGGSVQLLMTGGSADIGLVELVAQGVGGDAASGYDATAVASIAGQGVGGDATLDWRGGALTAGSLLIDGSGNGGSGRYAYEWNGASGADGTGGTARLLMADGAAGQIIVQEDIVVRAIGRGGRGADSESFSQTAYLAGNGGSGQGGMASVTLGGGALTVPSLFVSAQGVGGDGGENQGIGAGGAAGNGVGGTASLAYLSEGHSIDILTVTAAGEGGVAGSNRVFAGLDQNNNPIYTFGPGAGSAGGSGTGGTADLLIDVDPNFVSLNVSAEGIGSAGSTGATGGAGGIGTGGIATLSIGFGATSVSSDLRVSAVGHGGAGGNGLDGAGGRGGDAIGGSATLALTGSSTSLDANDLSVLAEAIGGAAGIGGLGQTSGVNGANGGAATGGAALFEIAAGANATTGALFKLSGDAIGGAGSAGTAGATGGLGGSGGGAAAGSATLRINGGRLRYAAGPSTAPSYSISAVGMGGAGAAGGDGSGPGGAGGNGGAAVGGVASFEATDGDYILGSLTIVSNGIGGLGGAGGTGSTVPPSNGIDGLSGGGTARLLNGGGVLAAGAVRQFASLSMMANGDQGGRILFTDGSTGVGGGLNVAGDMNLHATGTPVAGFTGIAFAAQNNIVQVDGAVDFLTEGPLNFKFSGGGGLAAGGALTGYSGTGITMNHASRLSNSYSLSGASVYLETPGAISLAGNSLLQAGSLLTLAGNGVSAQGLESGGAALLNAGAGDLSVFDIIAADPITASGRNISIGSSGGMAIDSAIGSGTVTLNAAGLFTVTDRVLGSEVTIGSGDIVIGSNAQIAASGLLRFRALNGQQPAIIGGADATGGYSLSAAELGQVSASNLAIDSIGDMRVRDLTVGTAILPGNGVLSLTAARRLRVEGVLRLTGRTGQGGASLSAGEALQVIAGAGLIDVSGGNGALAGLLSLSAPSIQVASLSAIEDLGSLDSIAVKEARLAQNDGLLSEEGWLRAGTIHLDASDEILVQNSGISARFDDRRGLTANSLILSDARGRPQVVINGRLALSTGEFATGLATIPLVSIDGRYAAGSRINGCLIATPGSCNGGTSGGIDNRETLDRLLDPTVSIATVFPLTLIQFRDVVTQGYPPLIDEPVTGAGNEDLWERRCGAEGEIACEAQ